MAIVNKDTNLALTLIGDSWPKAAIYLPLRTAGGMVQKSDALPNRRSGLKAYRLEQ
jgi:hypothetical protein